MNIITYEEVLDRNLSTIFVDVRSPSEFSHSTIPGAINIPIFNDEERMEIGKQYKESGRRIATKYGLEIIGPRILTLYNELENLNTHGKIIVLFCARGGMRSSTLASLFIELALPVYKLDNGYKGYRKYIVDNLCDLVNKFEYVTLYGNTGCGKTDILNELSKNNQDVLDLEMCANHRGSLFGEIANSKPHTQKYFESLIFDTLRSCKSSVIFIEGESKRIGKVLIPDCLYEKIKTSKKVIIESSIEDRVENIYQNYILNNFDVDLVMKSLDSMEKYIGSKKVLELKELVSNEEFKLIIEYLIIYYYDKKYSNKHVSEYLFNNDDSTKTAIKLSNIFLK